MELSSCDSLTQWSLDNSIYERALSSGTHGKGVILESNLVERMVLISGAWRLRCDAGDTVQLPSLNVVLFVQDQ